MSAAWDSGPPSYPTPNARDTCLRVLVHPAGCDRERAFEVAEELAGALSDPHQALWRVTARSHRKEVTALATNDARQRTRDREVGLDDDSRVGRERVASLPESRFSLLL